MPKGKLKSSPDKTSFWSSLGDKIVSFFKWIGSKIGSLLSTKKPKKPAGMADLPAHVQNQIGSFLPISEVNTLKKTNPTMEKNVQLTQEHKAIVELKKRCPHYTEELIKALGVENITSLPSLPDLVLYSSQSEYRDVGYDGESYREVTYEYTSIPASGLQGHQAAIGHTAENRPLISYMHNGEVVTVFNRLEDNGSTASVSRGTYRHKVDDWAILRGNQKDARQIDNWSEIGKEFRAAVASEDRPSPNPPPIDLDDLESKTLFGHVNYSTEDYNNCNLL